MDVTKEIATEGVSILIYADDMTLASTSLEKLQEAFDKLVIWAVKNNLKLNSQKTVLMTFRNGGRLPSTLKILHGDTQLARVSQFKYLGVTLQTSGKSFAKHVKDRVNAAISAMSDIKLLQKLSIQTSISLFHIKISPIMTYGIEIIWDHLTKTDLALIEKVKSIFLKKTLCLSKTTPSRLVYELTREPFYLEELRLKFQLPSTAQYQTVLNELHAKKSLIWSDFYTTDAMTTNEWKTPGYELRHTLTRFAVHGFHYKLCCKKHFHEPDETCICELCERLCDRYHAKACEKRLSSLTELCT